MVSRENPLLVVDDEFANRDMLSRRLERAGYPVEMAASAQEALAVIEKHQVELVLLDSMMPGMTGVELLKLLRAVHSQDQLPVIMVTAVNESQKIVEALSLGANDYITKPIDFPVALARIRKQLSHKWAEEALRNSEERYALAARGTQDGLWDWDLQTGQVYFSPRWKAILGYADSEIGDTPDDWLSRVHDGDREGLRSLLAAHGQKGNGDAEFSCEHRIRHKDDSYRWVLSRGTVLHAKDGEAVRMAGSLTDITQSKAFDPLTGLPNRLMFRERLVWSIEQRRKDQFCSFAVLFLDLDRFKVINDSLGHVAGDQLLIAAADRLRLAVRSRVGRPQTEPPDIVARLGGDEFVVLVEKVGDVSVAKAMAAHIQREICRPFILEGREVHTSASIGITVGNGQYETPTEVLRDADTAMYRAKSLGRARSEVFDASMRVSALARLEMESDLRLALERDEFVLHYQPKVKLQDGSIQGFEALVRWQHPVRGLVPPAQFIPLAEELGLIVPIGRWVLGEACRQMKSWHLRFPASPPLAVSVNLSVVQFRHPALVAEVEEILRETGLEPSSLRLELTESVLMNDTESAISILRQLKTLNVGLKMDDFGTGYSSLSYLHQLPFDTLKIDRSFVTNMNVDERSAELIKTILSLASNLNLEVVAEGIETEDQAARLKAFGCQFGQGYYFSRPVPVADAEVLISNSLSMIAGIL